MKTGRPGSPLSPRESEVLELMRQGLSNKEIARATGLGVTTVKTHLGWVYRRLGVESDRQALALEIARLRLLLAERDSGERA